jgi:pyruvate ferredoxin oxidoreductase gamma subunit
MEIVEELDVRIHGRGGQGTVTLAALLVDAAFEEGWKVLGIPSFGTERTGAPVVAFVRMSRQPIRDRSEIRHPSIVIVQDPTLIGTVDVLDGLTAGGFVLVNADRRPETMGDAAVEWIPATTLALEHLGKPKTNTAMLGLFAKATGLVSIESVVTAIRRWFPGELAERNVDLARAAYDAAKRREMAA